jgi:hypothetical protein
LGDTWLGSLLAQYKNLAPVLRYEHNHGSVITAIDGHLSTPLAQYSIRAVELTRVLPVQIIPRSLPVV